MRYVPALFIATFLWLTSCKDAPKQETKEQVAVQETEAIPPPQSRLDDVNTQRLLSVASRYFALKDALVAADPARANITAMELGKSVKDMETYIASDSVAKNSLQPYMDSIVMGTDAILAEVDDKTTEKKRLAFKSVSDAVFGLLKAAELKNTTIYRQYCPMALNDKGAYWLSKESKIRNPYFGDKMLECGETTDTLQ